MDKEIADRMRTENSEQFQTLVRMHLSFELDLNTDPVEWVFNQANWLLFLLRLYFMMFPIAEQHNFHIALNFVTSF